jgi:hypothetical protein
MRKRERFRGLLRQSGGLVPSACSDYLFARPAAVRHGLVAACTHSSAGARLPGSMTAMRLRDVRPEGTGETSWARLLNPSCRRCVLLALDTSRIFA